MTTDPLDTFELPDGLARRLSRDQRKVLRETIINITLRMDGDGEYYQKCRDGLHFSDAFDAIAENLKFESDFQEELVPDVIPSWLDEIHKGLNWIPGNFDGQDLRPFYLKVPLRKWRHAVINPSASGLYAIISAGEARCQTLQLKKQYRSVMRHAHYHAELKKLKLATKKYQTPELLREQFPDFEVWKPMDPRDVVDVANGDFNPSGFAWALVVRWACLV